MLGKSERMNRTIYVDLRCLQDRDFQRRGIGYHTASLLRGRRRSRLADLKTIGLVDPGMSPLLPEFSSLVDKISSLPNALSGGGLNIFIDGSPMTHDPRFNIRLQNDPELLRVAVLYDFIPLDWSGYLPSIPDRIGYLARLARIKYFDLFFPISEYTAGRLSSLLGVSRKGVHITGACVRSSLYGLRARLSGLSSPYDLNPQYFVTLGGDDRRKNTEVAIRAVQRLSLLYSRLIPLKVIGFYCDAYKHDLLRLAGHAEGAGFLEFYPRIPDEEIVSLHAGAIAAIAPSRIEGFSLPVAEAAVCGCPVLASTCAAHVELIDRPEALFQPDDVGGLSNKLDALLLNPELRASLVASQAHLGPRFREDVVASRFWNAIESAVESRRGRAVVAQPRKPRLAFLSPFPPDSSPAAFYTAMTMKAGSKLFDSDIYSDSARPLSIDGNAADCGPITPAPLLDRRYEAVVSVLGNCSSHKRAFEVFERFGGPCILHDVRLTQIYFELLGPAEFLKLAGGVIGRPVSMEEVHSWLQDHNPPSLFTERVIKRASPLMVHNLAQQTLLKNRYGAEAHVLTFCPSEIFDREELTEKARKAVREEYRIAENAFLIASFAQLARTNAIDSCVLAIDLLRSWGIPAELHFVGNSGSYKAEVDRISALYDIAGHVQCGNRHSDDRAFRDFLIASDAGVQLQATVFGQPPMALTNCISAGLPVMANIDAAEACDGPSYVFRAPHHFSPLHVAEQLALIWEARAGRASYADERAAYLQTHSFSYYATRLVEILGIA